MTTRFKAMLQKNGIFYLSGCLLLCGIKILFGTASPDKLKWMLAPTARWVSILSKISFSYDPQMGYVNHAWHFVIAPSCGGIRFLIICTAMLLFSCLHRIHTRKGKLFWTVCSPAAAYACTVFFNGMRIAASIHLPHRLAGAGLLDGRLTPKRLHTLTGVIIYFTALLLLRLITELIFGKIAAGRYANPAGSTEYSPAKEELSSCTKSAPCSIFLSPAIWYLLFVVALPIPGRLVHGNWNGFGEYVLLVSGGCLAVWIPAKTASILHRKFIRHARSR